MNLQEVVEDLYYRKPKIRKKKVVSNGRDGSIKNYLQFFNLNCVKHIDNRYNVH